MRGHAAGEEQIDERLADSTIHARSLLRTRELSSRGCEERCAPPCHPETQRRRRGTSHLNLTPTQMGDAPPTPLRPECPGKGNRSVVRSLVGCATRDDTAATYFIPGRSGGGNCSYCFPSPGFGNRDNHRYRSPDRGGSCPNFFVVDDKHRVWSSATPGRIRMSNSRRVLAFEVFRNMPPIIGILLKKECRSCRAVSHPGLDHRERWLSN